MQGNSSRTVGRRGNRLWLLLLLRLLLPRLLLLPRQRLLVVVVVVVVAVVVVPVVPLVQLLPLRLVGGELVAAELAEDGLDAGCLA